MEPSFALTEDAYFSTDTTENSNQKLKGIFSKAFKDQIRLPLRQIIKFLLPSEEQEEK